MGLSSSIVEALLAPVGRLLDGAVSTLIEEVIEVTPTVRRAELDGVRAALAAVQRELTARDTELHAVRQAADALTAGLDDELEALFGGESAQALLARTEEGLAAFARQIAQLSGGLDELSERVAALSLPSSPGPSPAA